MRWLVFTECYGNPYSVDGHRCAHGVLGKAISIAAALAKRGQEVDVAVREPEQNDMSSLGLTSVSYAVDPLEYDAVWFSDQPSYTLANANATQFDRLFEHDNLIMFADCPYSPDVVPPNVRAFGVSDPRCYYDMRKSFPNAEIFLWRWGADPVDRNAANPYPADSDPNRRLIFAGALKGHNEVRLNIIADAGYEVWIVTLGAPPLIEGAYRGFTTEERDRIFHRNIRFVTDFTEKRDPAFPHGPLCFGTFWPWIVHARLALNVVPPTQWVSCKISDYLACGTPVVTEPVPNAGDVLWYEAGQVVSRHPDSLLRGIRDELLITRDRDMIAKSFIKHQSWAVVADQLLEAAG